MANIFDVNRVTNDIVLGTTGTTINIASHTASTILGLDASKDLESLAIPLIVANGGTGLATITDGGLLLGSGTGAITPLAQATNGQLPIGSTGADCALAALTGTANQIAVANGAGSITLSTPQDIDTGADLVLSTVSVANYGLHVLDINGSHDLTFGCGSDLTADRALTFSPGNSNRTITLTGNPTLDDWFNQDVRTNASPQFTGLTVTNSGGNADITLTEYQNNVPGPALFTQKARGTSGTPLAIVQNDELGKLLFYGYDGDEFLNRAAIIAFADGAVSDNVIPTRLDFYTSAGGGSELRISIKNDGKVGIGTDTPDTKLQVVGDCKFGDDNTNYTEISSTGDIVFTGSAGLAFGSMYNDNTSTTVTIGTAGTFVRIPSGFTQGQVNNSTFGNAREITVTNAGMYKIDWSISFNTASGTNQDIEGVIGIDNTKNAQGTAHRFIGTASDIGNMGGTAILDLAANAVVSLMMTNNTNTVNIIVTHASLSLVQVGGT